MFLQAVESAKKSEKEEECQLTSVKMIVWSAVVEEGINTLIFYIFEYNAEYCAECSTESGATQHFLATTASCKSRSALQQNRTMKIYSVIDMIGQLHDHVTLGM